MVKPRSRRNNRKNHSKVASRLSRIASGVPVSKRNVPRDPPMLPHVLAYPVRSRFMLFMTRSTNQVGYSVLLAGTPTASNSIQHYFNPTSGSLTNGGGLTYNELFTASAMRVYGVDVTADPGGSNYVTTDYAIQKVVLYGTADATFDGVDITLSVDFGVDVPGFVGRDSSARNRRAVVAASPPRLSWRKIVAGSNVPALNYNTGIRRSPLADNSGIAFPTTYIETSQWPIGILDVTVLVRRSVISDATSFSNRAADTKFSSTD